MNILERVNEHDGHQTGQRCPLSKKSNSRELGSPPIGIDGGPGSGDWGGHRRIAVADWPTSGEIAIEYGDIIDSVPCHNGEIRWFKKFGISEGKLSRVMVGGVQLVTHWKKTERRLKHCERSASSRW